MRIFLGLALLTVCGLVLAAPWASESPDGLEHALGEHAVANDAPAQAETPRWALFPGYAWRGGSGGTVIAGLLGAGAVLALGWALGLTLPARAKQDPRAQ